MTWHDVTLLGDRAPVVHEDDTGHEVELWDDWRWNPETENAEPPWSWIEAA